MALYRKFKTSFWRDTINDELNRDEQHLYAYLLTNESTQLCGIYKLGRYLATVETGMKAVEYDKALGGLVKKNKIRYSPETQEILLLRWHTFYPNKSITCKVRVTNELSNVKDRSLVEIREKVLEGYVFAPEPDEEDELDDKPPAKEYVTILGHLSDVTGRTYNPTTVSYQKLIRTRRKENPKLTIEDFIAVIDEKARQWLNTTDHDHHLRPETLFGQKFPTYLAEAGQRQPQKTVKKEKVLCPVCGAEHTANTQECLRCHFNMADRENQAAIDAHLEFLRTSGLAARVGLHG